VDRSDHALADGYSELLAQLESLAPEGAESILSSLAAALFPTGAGTLNQVSWETNRQKAQPAATTPGEAAEQGTLEKLRAAELRYRTLLEQIPAVTFMAVLGEGQNEVYVSPHIEALLGFSQKEWLENPFLWYTQLHPNDRAMWHEEFARGCRTGGPFRAECRFIARDGRVVWVRGEARLIKDDVGRPLFLQGVAFDITESKQAQAIVLREAVSTTEERYRDLVEQTGAIFWEAELDKPGFTFVSQGAEHILGFPVDRWLDDPEFWIGRVHPDDREPVVKAWTQARDPQSAGGEFEFRGITASGRTLWLHQKVFTHRAASGEPRRIGVILDVTDRKEAEEVLRKNAANLQTEADIRRTLHRIGTELASQLTLERVVQLATDEATTLTKAAFGAFFYNVINEQGEAYTLYTLSGVPREAFEKFPMPRNTAVFGPTFSGSGIIRLDDVTKDPRYGKNAPYRGMPEGHLPVRSYLAIPVISRSGEVLGGMFFGHSDAGVFTEEHERLAAGIAGWTALAIDNARLYTAAESARAAAETAYAAAERARELAESANRAKDEFLATMSHELRTPLNAVMGWIQILRSGAVTNENRERGLATIERNARAQGQIIDDLLDVSRIVTGKLVLKTAPVDLISVIDGAIEAVGLAISAKQLVVRKHLDSSAAIVVGDGDRLRQAVSNLLTNAVKFTEQGGRIDVRLEARRGMARLQVADDGQGIDPAFLPHVFDRFKQADSSTTRVHGGLGLGLAIVRHLVEMHGGKVGVESGGLDKGATFTIELPLGVAPAEPREAKGQDNDLAELLAVLKNAQVLVVDDETDSSEMVASLLSAAGALVVTASSVAEALRAIHDRVPQVVISDIGMPYADGYAFLRELGAIGEPYASIPVVALTAYAREEDRLRALAAGFRAHLGKPFESKDLLRRVAEILATAPAD
jgi:PAS domain S-box-containing protein